MSSTQSHLDNFARARLNMIESQIRAGGVTNAHVLAAMADVPREQFAPPDQGLLAYAEMHISLSASSDPASEGRYLLSPLLLARMIDALGIHEGDLVLDIGCASGYSTAILAHLVGMGTVVGLETDAALAEQASRMLERLNLDNTVIITDQLNDGYPAQSPYDVILLNGASAQSPKALASLFADQLREGGRFAGVFDDGGDISGRAWLFRKKEGKITRSVLFDARAAVLPGFDAKPAGFRFPGISKKSAGELALNQNLSKAEGSSSSGQGAQENWPAKEKKESTAEASAAGSPPLTQKSGASEKKDGLSEETSPIANPSIKSSSLRAAPTPQEKSSAPAATGSAPASALNARKEKNSIFASTKREKNHHSKNPFLRAEKMKKIYALKQPAESEKPFAPAKTSEINWPGKKPSAAIKTNDKSGDKT